MNTFSTTFVVVIVIVLFDVIDVISAVTFTNKGSDIGFTPIELDVDYQSIDSITIDLSCDSDSISFPNMIVTIFPSNEGDGVTVETLPANLVTVPKDEYGDFNFEWNTYVASTATTGGVRIGIPRDQLKKVLVMGGQNVQILNGFTHITYLGVQDYGSVLTTSMTSSISTKLRLRNYGGHMSVQTNVPITSGSVTGGRSYVETPSYNDIYVEGSGSELHIKGDVDVSNDVLGGTVRKDSRLTVTGTITGIIHSLDDSIVNAPSCYNVQSTGGSGSSGTCNAGPQRVDVDVRDLSQTYVSSSSSLVMSSCHLASIATVVAIVATVMLI